MKSSEVLLVLINAFRRINFTLHDTDKPYLYCGVCLYSWRENESPSHSDFCEYAKALKAIEELEEEV